MRKVFAVLLIVTALVFVSCNADQTLGIFAEVAASQPVAGIKIVRYLGSYDNENYILADDGIYKGSEPIFTNSSENGYISSAYLDTEYGEISVLTNEGKAGKLTKEGNEYVIDLVDSPENKITLTDPYTEDYVYLTLSDGYYIGEGPSAILETDGYLLLSFINETGFVVNIFDPSNAVLPQFTLLSRPVGFQPLGDGKFIIMTSSNNFYLANTNNSEENRVTPLGSSTAFTSQSVTQVPSFEKGGIAYFKAPSTFVEVSGIMGDFKLSGAASDLATASITNIIKEEENHWIAATRKSGLYEITYNGEKLVATPIEF